MTLKQSLEICVEQWDWLAANPTKSKGDWTILNPDKLHTRTQCACCEYVMELKGDIGGTNCESCPLVSFWLAHTEENHDKAWLDREELGYCEYSIYEKYLYACAFKNTEDVSRYAKMIADAARAELATLDSVKE